MQVQRITIDGDKKSQQTHFFYRWIHLVTPFKFYPFLLRTDYMYMYFRDSFRI